MEELLDRISQEGLLVVCVVLAVVALLLALIIVAEIVVSKRRQSVIYTKDSDEEEPKKDINIKYDENITYVKEDSDEEREKAKAELAKIKNRLIEEDNKKKLEEKKEKTKAETKEVEIAKQVDVEKTEEKIEEKETVKDVLEGTKEYKVFGDPEAAIEEKQQEELYEQIDNMLEKQEENKEIDEDEDNYEARREEEVVHPQNKEIIKEEEKIEKEKEEIEEETDSYSARRNEIDINKMEIVYPTSIADAGMIAKQENKVEINEEKDVDDYEARREEKEEPKQEQIQPVEEPKKEEPVVEETKPKEKIDQATKDRIIDEYLKQAIIQRINEEKEKQLQLKEKIEKERKVLLFDDNNLEVIDSFMNPSINEKSTKEEMEKEVDNNISILNKIENEILDKDEKDNKPSLYEELEEENAIISYDELIKAAKFGFTDEEMNNYADEKDAIISMDELERLYKEVNNIAKNDPKMDFSNVEFKKVEDLPKISDEKIFKKSEFISPIYGQERNEKDIELEQTMNLNKLSEEIKKTNEFLATLKDLQKNLE